ncbi:MAG: hypothetical protein ACE1ZZ_00085 [Dehalococcoidia bacterium]
MSDSFPGTWYVLRLSFRRQINPQRLAQDFPLNSEIIPGNMRTIRSAALFHQSAEDGWESVPRGDNVKFCQQV